MSGQIKQLSDPIGRLDGAYEMADGSLLLGVDYDGGGGPYFVWRSTDGGKIWDKSQTCEPRDFKSQYGFFGGITCPS